MHVFVKHFPGSRHLNENFWGLLSVDAVQASLSYNEYMTTSTALHQLFDSVGNCLSLEAASKLQKLRITDELQSQLDSWATQNSAGVLDAEERQQYEAILRALNFVAVLQAKARHIAEESTG